jgi:aminoglycoside phosphotransferase (APT) family kinase protein
VTNSSVNILKQAIADKGLSWSQFADYCGIIYGELLGWLMRTYLPDQQTVRLVSNAANLDEPDILARVEKDRQTILAWAKKIVLQAGIDDVRTIRQIPGGRNFVFAVNEEWILKVACDELGEDQQLLREQAIYEFLARHREIPAAEFGGAGSEPTLWLVIRKVDGLPLEQLWTNITHEAIHEVSPVLSPDRSGQALRSITKHQRSEQRHDVCFQLGQLMAHLHALPCEELRGNQHIFFYTSTTWSKLVLEGISNVLRALRESARYSQSQMKELEEFIVAHESVLDFDFRPALLFGDYYDMHICLVQHQDGYYISGMFDFGEVMVGEPSWEFVYVNNSFLHQSPDYIAAFRKGYETMLPFPILSLERLTLYTIWANRDIDVWHSDCESFGSSRSLVAAAQEYWRHWL